MRGASTSIGRRLPSSEVFFTGSASNKNALNVAFSTSSGRGRGRGPGAGVGPGGLPVFEFSKPDKAPGKPESDDSIPSVPMQPQSQQQEAGHGRGKPLPADASHSPFSSFINSIKSSQAGAGRGTAFDQIPAAPPKMPATPSSSVANIPTINAEQTFPEGLSSMSSVGRGKPLQPASAVERVDRENRHIRVQQKQTPRPPRVSKETALKNEASAMDPKFDGARPETKGKWKKESGQQWERRPRGRREEVQEVDEENGKVKDSAMEAIAKAQVDKFAKHFGVDVMNQFEDMFREVANKVLPSPADEEFLDVLHTSCSIEFEPEYLMGEFNQNPDIEEKPPMTLEDFLNKIKPFMMVYMRLETEEEWEEAVQVVMKNAPLFKEIVDYYSGPDRITAKTQEKEMKKVAESVPTHAPLPMKAFVDRAVLSLQSNPGWKFDKKLQFMNKLVREVHHYK